MEGKPARKGRAKRRFKVRYARIVLMETVVEAKSEGDVRDEGLPGVFDGIPTGLVGPHVDDVQDYEHVWEVKPAEADAGRRRGQAAPMADGEYAGTGGAKCPFCRGKDVKANGAIMPDDRDGAMLEVECSDCGRSWRDVYRLVGYEADDQTTETKPDKEE